MPSTNLTSPPRPSELRVRPAGVGDLLELVELSRQIWGTLEGWKASELLHHQAIFPDGQLVAVGAPRGSNDVKVLGMAVSLILERAACPIDASWDELTGHGRLDTHVPSGDLLYAAGIGVRPEARGLGIGRRLYHAREALLQRRGLDAIRAGARIPGYHRVADQLTPEAYVASVVRGERSDPTLSFQLALGFRVIGIARGYLDVDRESRGMAAVVEWTPPAEETPRS